ncbi:lytic transglycosylase domain-containing protein [Mahella australiensis]|uniref:Lytic transglycosylase catalytic n=1 Tax=Mahella australiensis (strain DSM 15567 / CIP 107919 / 50-1 BON) TaxID=697281 RepID=F3ZVL6_MAHA5|nr:lytic transglycosylase domain-containing protein [Mahella australiensis]AEE96378.1 Lytic transglycosylase catalytic [Mahella australiensis 50-1 BON]
MRGRIIALVFVGIIIVGILVYHLPYFQRIIYPLEYDEYIWPTAYEHGIDPRLVAAVIYVESRFQPEARSHKHAMGLMQITPDTGRWIAQRLGISGYHENMLNDPKTNIRFGVWYIEDLKREFDDDMVLVLAAYNAGRGNVKQWLEKGLIEQGKGTDGIPFAETKEYVAKVMDAYEHYKGLYND